MESENGLMLKLPVSLNLPIVELLQALQSVQQKNGEPLPKSKPAMPKELAPPMQPGLLHMAAPGLQGPPTEEPKMSGVAAQPPAGVTKSLSTQPQQITWDNALSDLQPEREQSASSRYDISSSTKNWILRDEDLPVIEKLKIKRLNPVPIKRKAPTPKVADLAAVEARAEEAFKKAMEMSLPAEPSLRAPPQMPPPTSNLPPGSAPGGPPSEARTEAERLSRLAPPPTSAPPPPPPAPGSSSARGADAGPPGLAPPKNPKGKPKAPASPPTGGNESDGMSNEERAKQKEKEAKECKQQ